MTCMLKARANTALMNRRQDLDPAVLSCFNAAVTFGLPSEPNRCPLACCALAGTWHISLAGAEMVTCMPKAQAGTARISCASYSWPSAMDFDAGLNADWAVCMRRQQIMQQYATHLSEEDIAELARATEGMSGRDLRDIAEQSERRTASKVRHGIYPPSTSLNTCSTLRKAARPPLPSRELLQGIWP